MNFNKVLLLSTCAVLTSINIAHAKDPVEEKINRIERRIVAMEKQVYSGKAGTSSISADNQLLAQMQAKLQTMEENNARLYGKVEELAYAVEKLAEQAKLMSEDFDYRLNNLESAKGESLNQAEKTPKEETLKASSENTAAVKVVVPEKLSPDDLYEKAFNYMSSTQYAKSEAWFEAFIERFPEHKLADNAYYWLGEVRLVQGDAKGAVLAFSKGLKSFPNGVKASANLLKIGVAFKQMDNSKHAKSSWNKLINDYPNSPEASKASKLLESLEN